MNTFLTTNLPKQQLYLANLSKESYENYEKARLHVLWPKNSTLDNMLTNDEDSWIWIGPLRVADVFPDNISFRLRYFFCFLFVPLEVVWLFLQPNSFEWSCLQAFSSPEWITHEMHGEFGCCLCLSAHLLRFSARNLRLLALYGFRSEQKLRQARSCLWQNNSWQKCSLILCVAIRREQAQQAQNRIVTFTCAESWTAVCQRTFDLQTLFFTWSLHLRFYRNNSIGYLIPSGQPNNVGYLIICS